MYGLESREYGFPTCRDRADTLFLPDDELVGVVDDLKLLVKALHKRVDSRLAGVTEGIRRAQDEQAAPAIVVENEHAASFQQPPTQHRIFQNVVFGV